MKGAQLIRSPQAFSLGDTKEVIFWNFVLHLAYVFLKAGGWKGPKTACVQISLCGLYRGHTEYLEAENKDKLHSKGSCQVTF
jgi:hypothetical protein